jgi:hypothetical protein
MSTSFSPSPDRVAALIAIRDSNPGTRSASQRTRLLSAIERLGSVTTFEAMRFLDVFDPRPRKLELVRRGHPIESTRDRMETEAGVVHRIGRYFMDRQKTKEVTE